MIDSTKKTTTKKKVKSSKQQQRKSNHKQRVTPVLITNVDNRGRIEILSNVCSDSDTSKETIRQETETHQQQTKKKKKKQKQKQKKELIHVVRNKSSSSIPSTTNAIHNNNDHRKGKKINKHKDKTPKKKTNKLLAIDGKTEMI